MMVSDAGAPPAWREIEQSDVFTWFGMHEVGQERPRPGVVRRHLKPGGHQEARDLTLELAGERLAMAELTLDRAWMDGGATAPFADDLAKSVLLVLAPGRTVIGDVAERIFHLGLVSAAGPRAAAPLLRRGARERAPVNPPAQEGGRAGTARGVRQRSERLPPHAPSPAEALTG